MSKLVQEGIIPTFVAGAPPIETFHILTEDSNNLAAENDDLLITE